MNPSFSQAVSSVLGGALCSLIAAVGLAQGPGPAEAQLREGQEAYRAHHPADAVSSLRIAAFGFLDRPAMLCEALVYLALANEASGNPAEVQSTLDRIAEAQRRTPTCGDARLDSAIRAEFESKFHRRLSVPASPPASAPPVASKPSPASAPREAAPPTPAPAAASKAPAVPLAKRAGDAASIGRASRGGQCRPSRRRGDARSNQDARAACISAGRAGGQSGGDRDPPRARLRDWKSNASRRRAGGAPGSCGCGRCGDAVLHFRTRATERTTDPRLGDGRSTVPSLGRSVPACASPPSFAERRPPVTSPGTSHNHPRSLAREHGGACSGQRLRTSRTRGRPGGVCATTVQRGRPGFSGCELCTPRSAAAPAPVPCAARGRSVESGQPRRGAEGDAQAFSQRAAAVQRLRRDRSRAGNPRDI